MYCPQMAANTDIHAINSVNITLLRIYAIKTTEMKTKSFKEILKETIQRNCTDDYDGMFLFFESSVIEAHNEYASQFQQEWIPVEVRLPEFGESVLVFCRIYGRFIASYEFIGEFQNEKYGNWSDGKNIGILPPTHWMLLPLPPLPQPYNPNQQ